MDKSNFDGDEAMKNLDDLTDKLFGVKKDDITADEDDADSGEPSEDE